MSAIMANKKHPGAIAHRSYCQNTGEFPLVAILAILLRGAYGLAFSGYYPDYRYRKIIVTSVRMTG